MTPPPALPSPSTIFDAQPAGILRDLLSSEIERVRALSLPVPTSAPDRTSRHPFEDALRQAAVPVIAEFKRASPSLGPFAAEVELPRQIGAYKQGEAAALSILAEPLKFLGRPQDFAQARPLNLPILYKGFVCSREHLLEAVHLDAQAILLIARVLGEHLSAFLEAAKVLGLEALVEVHGPSDFSYAQSAHARIIGWNSRDLSTFKTLDAPVSLRQLFPEALLIRESGIKSPEDGRRALESGFDGLLIGEALMRAQDPAAFLQGLKGAQG